VLCAVSVTVARIMISTPAGQYMDVDPRKLGIV